MFTHGTEAASGSWLQLRQIHRHLRPKHRHHWTVVAMHSLTLCDDGTLNALTIFRPLTDLDHDSSALWFGVGLASLVVLVACLS